ncbi:MAG: hypothetical protein KAS32_13135 [Candidatus Peribacteraceae bacterium]|nr:hypothetical protein [Candidatus Peribacteraceae bacterium]
MKADEAIELLNNEEDVDKKLDMFYRATENKTLEVLLQIRPKSKEANNRVIKEIDAWFLQIKENTKLGRYLCDDAFKRIYRPLKNKCYVDKQNHKRERKTA